MEPLRNAAVAALLLVFGLTGCAYDPYKPNEKYLNRASRHLRAGETASAEFLMKKALETYEDYHEPHLVYAGYLTTQGRNREAIAYYRKAEENFHRQLRRNWDPWGTLSTQYMLSGVYDRFYQMQIEAMENDLELGRLEALKKYYREKVRGRHFGYYQQRSDMLYLRALPEGQERDSIRLALEKLIPDSSDSIENALLPQLSCELFEVTGRPAYLAKGAALNAIHRGTLEARRVNGLRILANQGDSARFRALLDSIPVEAERDVGFRLYLLRVKALLNCKNFYGRLASDSSAEKNGIR